MNRRPSLRRPRARHQHLSIKGGVVNTSKLRDFFRREMYSAKRDGSWFRLGSVERGVYSLAVRLDVKPESRAIEDPWGGTERGDPMADLRLCPSTSSRSDMFEV